jgi:hypothetical protein
LQTVKTGTLRLKHFGKVMFEHKAGDSIEYLKSLIGSFGTQELAKNATPVPSEIESILNEVVKVARSR